MIRKFFQANELPEGVGQPVYILPGSWFNRWKAYNNFQKLMGDASEDKDFMVDESGEKPLYPGAINPLELIDEAHINLFIFQVGHTLKVLYLTLFIHVIVETQFQKFIAVLDNTVSVTDLSE
mmetsp:Transcript_38969/g.34651  ORF Transcript_38969/g.34651 Transcript_38969/m.34651 type:complete len:122 (-) Transcript_38969:231-596(-)